MEIALAKAVVIEAYEVEEEKKNDKTGKYEKTGTVYYKLSVYPIGQTDRNRNVLNLSVAAEKFAEAQALCGRTATISVDMRTNKFGTFYDYLGARIVKEQPGQQAA